MAIERLLERQAPLLLIADGGENGLVTLNSVESFKVKQKVVLSSATQPDLKLQIKRVISPTKFLVGPIKDNTSPGKPSNNLNSRTNISAYTIADGATVRSPEQNRVRLDPRDIIQAVYEQEPTIALRTHTVDKIGNSHKDTRSGNNQSGDALPANTAYGQVNHDPIEVLNDGDYSAQQLNRAGGNWNSIMDFQTHAPWLISPSGAANVAELIRLVGGNFVSGQPLLTHIWTTTPVNGGSIVTTDGELILSTNTTANGEISVESARSARFITATYNISHQGVGTNNPNNVDVIRRWGAFDPSSVSENGIYFENDSGNISIVRVKNGVRVEVVTEANFNGNNTFITDNNVHIYEIIYNAGAINFMQGRKLIHRMFSVDAAAFGTPHLKIGHQILNINGNTVNNTMVTRGSSISRIGSSSTIPEPFYIDASGTFFVKNSPGRLHRIIIGDKGTGASTIILYNSTIAGGEILATIDSSDVSGSLDYAGMEFDIGLTIVVSGGSVVITIVYD